VAGVVKITGLDVILRRLNKIPQEVNAEMSGQLFFGEQDRRYHPCGRFQSGRDITTFDRRVDTKLCQFL